MAILGFASLVTPRSRNEAHRSAVAQGVPPKMALGEQERKFANAWNDHSVVDPVCCMWLLRLIFRGSNFSFISQCFFLERRIIILHEQITSPRAHQVS